jgi:hypothetical protein
MLQNHSSLITVLNSFNFEVGTGTLHCEQCAQLLAC